MSTLTIGWRPTCRCRGTDPVPATVLDPFGGSGTTGMVAERLGRNAILIELSPKYARMARRRINATAPERRQFEGDPRHSAVIAGDGAEPDDLPPLLAVIAGAATPEIA